MPIGAAARDDEYRPFEREVDWSDTPIEFLLSGLKRVVGMHNEDFCGWVAYHLGVEPSAEDLDRCADGIGSQQSAWVPETMLPAIIESTAPAVASECPSPAPVPVEECVEPEPEPKPDKPSPLTEFGDGFYVVGEDIRPGTYRARVLVDCYWARYRDFNDGLIDNGIADNARVYEIRIKKTDAAFESKRCGTWKRVTRK